MTSSAPSALPSARTAPCYPLDSLVDETSVALIKIDVEGHELRVLKGAEQILTRFCPILYVENDRIEQSPELIAWLLDRGYRLWWHITRAFNPSNFLQNPDNVYGDVSLINMLGLHPSLNIALDGLPEITDATQHPLTPSAGKPKLNPAVANAAQKPAPAGTPYAAPR